MTTNSNLTAAEKALADLAQRAAVRGASGVLKREGVVLDDAGMDRLSDAVCVSLRAALPVALADSKEAFACGMFEIGERTFVASMVLAGVKAANEVLASLTATN